MANLTIDGVEISPLHPPYIVAEMSANHNGKIEAAFKIIEQAKAAGADAVKLQTYTADTITLKSERPEFKISGGLWDGRTLHDLYNEAHTPWDWHPELFACAKDHDITIFSSPFDFSAVDFLEGLGAPAYKIASFEAIDLPLIEYAASTKKPLIISTGMCNFDEISEAADAALGAGCDELVLLHCVSGYPAPPEDYNLRTILDMKERFGLPVGLSDHTLDNSAAISSVALGACFIEKHFTLDRNAGGPDDSFSLEPADLKNLCEMTKIAHSALGVVSYEAKESEKQNIQFRRSLYVVEDIQEGEPFSNENVRSVRPGNGLPPKMLPDVLGKTASCSISKNTPLSLDLLAD
jgi:pseudaminic acid synthase